MTREQFDKLYKNKAVWCKTEALAKEFLALADSVGYKWFTERSLLTLTRWGVFQEETVYLVNYFVENTIYYGETKDVIVESWEIVEFAPTAPRVYDSEALAFELKLIHKHLSPLDNLISGLIDLVKVEDLAKVKELRDYYEKMSEIIESLKGE